MSSIALAQEMHESLRLTDQERRECILKAFDKLPFDQQTHVLNLAERIVSRVREANPKSSFNTDDGIVVVAEAEIRGRA